MSKINKVILLLGWLFIMVACQKLENTIDIEIPPSENELVVECYLEAGQPYRLLLTETKNYFDVTNICPFVRSAIVVITHDGIKDTLVEAPYSGSGCSSIMPFWNSDSTRIFNYGSTTICPSSFSKNFVLEVWDTLTNRQIHSETQFIPSVPITTFRVDFNADTIASCILGCKDNLATMDYYRLVLHKTSTFRRDDNALFKYVAENPYFDQIIYDQAIFAAGDILHASNYQFYDGDTLIGTIYHLDQAYYDYTQTSRNAKDANLNPFVEPSGVISNIQGGHGIFTFLSYERDTLYVP